MPSASTPASRRVVPDTRRRDTLIAVAVGVAILGMLVYAVSFFSRQSSENGAVEGTIVSKHFAPQAETQITFGRDGLNSRQIDGEYSFEVRVSQENGKVYKVFVGKQDYETRREGEQFRFFRQ